MGRNCFYNLRFFIKIYNMIITLDLDYVKLNEFFLLFLLFLVQ